MRKSIHDLMRERLLIRAGILETQPRYSLAELEASEWSHRFERMMRNRLIMGAMRYGCLRGIGKKQYNRIEGARKRLVQYDTTGNLECLVDVANLMLLEFEEGQHPNRHWSDMTDDHCCI